MTNSNPLHSDNKINEFTQALQRYLNDWRYKGIEKLVSFLVMLLQAMALYHVITTYHQKPLYLLFAVLTAYVITDFINGLVHMYMDNNTHYTSCIGPFIAAFHLHHATYFYRVRHPLKVYFDESGTKFWLLGYLIILVVIQFNYSINTTLNTILVAFAVFSSLAELSHYWCHNANEKNKIIRWLQNHHLLLSKQHHKAHHCNDNIQYAFLNGMTDPLINYLARTYYKGYKNYADKHTQAYLNTFGHFLKK